MLTARTTRPAASLGSRPTAMHTVRVAQSAEQLFPWSSDARAERKAAERELVEHREHGRWLEL